MVATSGRAVRRSSGTVATVWVTSVGSESASGRPRGSPAPTTAAPVPSEIGTVTFGQTPKPGLHPAQAAVTRRCPPTAASSVTGPTAKTAVAGRPRAG